MILIEPSGKKAFVLHLTDMSTTLRVKILRHHSWFFDFHTPNRKTSLPILPSTTTIGTIKENQTPHISHYSTLYHSIVIFCLLFSHIE